jgi:tetratricopeptide (TPR) repeat protein
MAVGERGQVDGAERAADALARADWAEGLAHLQQLDEERALSPAELELLAQAAYGSGDLEAAITAWERLHADRVAAGEHRAAAAAATKVAMYLMMDTGMMAPVRGWVSRAERLLEGLPEAPVHAWLAMVRTYERLLSGDLENAAVWARRAIDVGTRQQAPGATAMGRVATARLRILDGRVDEGLALLDEAAVATVSGELEPLTVGMVYCELVCAMQGLAQYDRAEEWTEAMEHWRRDHAFGGMHGRCRVHRAEILRLRGSCDAAEAEALHACEELRPWMRREYGWPLTELGTIRLRRGDLAGAEEAYLAAHEHGWDPHPGLALLRLAQGRAHEAHALIRDALERPVNVPSKERPPSGGLRRAPLLEAQVEIALAVGEVDEARSAADELTGTAESFRSLALLAGAALARGRVALATCDAVTAVRECGRAVDGWCEVAAPYEVAVARLALAEAHRAAGNEQAGLLEARAARVGFERIGAQGRVREAVAAAGAPAATDPTPGPASAATGPSIFQLEGDTRRIAFDGTTVLLRDLKGMRYLARLLAEPDRERHVLDLVAIEEGVAPAPGPAGTDGLVASSGGHAGAALDSQAKEAYRRRLRDIEDDIEEAVRLGDTERVALAEADRDYLVRELSRSFGLGGRARTVGSTSERARASVTRALRYALDRVASHHPALGDHLSRTVYTGTYCSYRPDPRAPIDWTT